jgi:DNA-binding MarR family transcriptional regulator
MNRNLHDLTASSPCPTPHRLADEPASPVGSSPAESINVLHTPPLANARLGRLCRSCSLTQIAVFEAVARLGSITRAADEVCLAQPTVSLQMKRLSEALGTQLFQMRGRRLELTPAGQELFTASRQILARLAEVQRLVATVPGLAQPACVGAQCPDACPLHGQREDNLHNLSPGGERLAAPLRRQ